MRSEKLPGGLLALQDVFGSPESCYTASQGLADDAHIGGIYTY